MSLILSAQFRPHDEPQPHTYKQTVKTVSCVKKLGEAKDCKFPTKKIMDAQNFDFAPKFSQNEVFCFKFCIFGSAFF